MLGRNIMKQLKQNKLVIILGILLVIAVIYIAVDKVQASREGRDIMIYQRGMEEGYALGVQQLMEGLAECQPVPVFAGENRIHAIAVECLVNDLPKCNAMTLGVGNQTIEIVDTSCLQQ